MRRPTEQGDLIMLQNRPRSSLLTALAVAAGVLAASASTLAQAQDRKSIRWATSNTGSYGYKVAAAMTKILEEALGGEYTVTVNPYPSTTGAMKATMDGTGELGYTADVGMTQLYAGEGGFANYDPSKGKLVHTWYAYPMETFMAVPSGKGSEFKCWRDFSGKPVFFTTAGFMNWLNMQRVFKTLGYDFKHVQIDPATQADALQSGTIVGATAYTTAGASLASYWRETELRTDVAMVNPCPDEIAKLKAAGMGISEVDPKKAFSKDVGVQKIYGVPVLFAYNARADMPEDVVYRMLTAFYKNRDGLAQADPGFAPLAKDFIGLQVQGINSNPEVPVHPGMAKFLREHKAWNDKWKVAPAS
jgi:hypothetical protein